MIASQLQQPIFVNYEAIIQETWLIAQTIQKPLVSTLITKELQYRIWQISLLKCYCGTNALIRLRG